jgi:putative chitinase
MRRIAEHELHEVMPHAGARVEQFAVPINETCARFDISTPARQAAFLAQIAHESDHLRRVRENMMYTNPEQLRRIHPTDFDPLDDEDAWGYVRQPERIANRVYANQNGNGPEASGDGWRYRGGGLIQLTGRENYRAMGRALGVDLEASPELVEQPKWATLTAGQFWRTRGLNTLADAGDFELICRRVNGGRIGMEERIALYEKALAVLA